LTLRARVVRPVRNRVSQRLRTAAGRPVGAVAKSRYMSSMAENLEAAELSLSVDDVARLNAPA
jgi:hypothetical protein